MAEKIIEIRDLYVDVEEKNILHGVNLSAGKGETHVLMGPNGAGKSTLGNVLMGSPFYTVTSGDILYKGENIVESPVHERAQKGIFLSFQNPVEVGGISLSNFIRSAVAARTGERVRLWDFKKQLAAAMELLSMDSSYADRDLNVGFSGGEKKKAEILQLLMLKPDLAILDEPDSGLDVDAVRTVSKGIREYQNLHEEGTMLIITHSTKILEALHVDRVHVLVDGRIRESGDASLIEEINQNGYEKFINAK
ncbi:MAG: Fe-S cluster assembly ATPase SufC [Lachnospiraceae bacterium]|nr:Fe-S cluster assembly ATPase SufC [Lachnospiraceae bacterium]